MKWEKVKLGDCCTKIGSGSTPKGGSTVYIDEGVALIRSQNVYNLSFDYSGLVFINSEAAEKLNGVKIEPNDILLNITGDSVARTCLVPIEVIPARVNQHVSIIRPRKNVLDATFLSYYLASPFMQSFMLGLAVGKGTSRNAMTKDMISNFEIPCPAMAIQKKIASILKSYDDLIENNQKHIKLLEEAAQRLYKEWFVDLRFPGHEGVNVVDGVPEGWKIKKIEELADTMSGGTPTRSHEEYYSSGEILWLKTKELNDGFIFDTEEKITEAGLKNSSAKLFEKGCIILAMYGATIGRLGISSVTMCCNQACCVLKIKEIFLFEYVYLWLVNNREMLISRGRGSAQSNLSQELIKQIEVRIPSEGVLIKFSNVVDKLLKNKEILEKQISSLREARDRLLPKLMSGEIEV